VKILMTADTLGGVWTYALDLCRGLERHGVGVVLATMGAALSSDQRRDVRGVRNVMVEESTHRLEWMPEPWNDVTAAGAWLLELEQRVAPDVVHLNGYVHAALPWSAPVLVVAHSCVLSWWRAVHGCDAPPRWDRYRAAVAAGLAAADRVVAPTRAILDAVLACYDVHVPGCVVPNGRHHDAVANGIRASADRLERTAAPQPPFVFGAGRVWDDAKNLRALAAAAPLMHWPVYVAGSDTSPDGARHALSGVEYLGVLDSHAMRQWHRRASVFVHPAVYEPFGLAPLEAAQAGSALVLGDIAPLREVWGDAALFVAPSDPVAIAAAVNRLAADPPLLARLSEAAQRRGRALTARRMADAYRDQYASLVEGAARRSGVAQEAAPCG
jgi:glycogen synthase